MFFQVTFKHKDGSSHSDMVLEESGKANAEFYAENRRERCENYVASSVKRISRERAQQMADNNAVNWTSTLN
jgi:hypothetical protein